MADDEAKAKSRAANERWKAKLAADPVRLAAHRERQARRNRRYRQRKKVTMTAEQRADHREKNRIANVRHREEIAADPDRYSVWREKKRAYCRQWQRVKRAEIRAYAAEVKRQRRAGVPAQDAMNSSLRKSFGQNKLYSSALAAVPATLPRDVRDDVVSTIIMAVLEGDIAERDIPKRAKEFVRAHYRQFDQFKTSSLDDVIPGTDGLRRIDLLVDESSYMEDAI